MSAPPPSPDMPLSPVRSEVERLFDYEPSQAAAIAFVFVFLALALVQLYLYWKHRPDGYMLVVALTALIGESLGFAIRIIAINHPTTGIFIITTLLILLSPCATALVNYIVCGRVLAFTGQNVGCLRPNWIAKAFLLSDVATFLIQGMGGALTISTNPSTITMGKNIVTAGLVFQILSFCLFVYVALSVQFMQRYGFQENRCAQSIFWAMHATMCCFIVRTVYRIIEFNGGQTGYGASHEWCFYVFDAGFMVIAFVIYSLPPLHFGLNVNKLSAERAGTVFDAAGKPEQAAGTGPPGMLAMSTNVVTPAPLNQV